MRIIFVNIRSIISNSGSVLALLNLTRELHDCAMACCHLGEEHSSEVVLLGKFFENGSQEFQLPTLILIVMWNCIGDLMKQLVCEIRIFRSEFLPD